MLPQQDLYATGIIPAEHTMVYNLLNVTFTFLKFFIYHKYIITVVRIKFSNLDMCKNDGEQSREENETIAKIVYSCRDFDYVDPPTNIQILIMEKSRKI